MSNIKHAVVSVDVVIFMWSKGQLMTCLIDVKNEEYKGMKAFPGGLVYPEETTDDAAKRVLVEKVNLSPNQIYIDEFGVYSEVDRDKRGRVVSISYMAIVEASSIQESLIDSFVPFLQARKLAYDHNKIAKDSLQELQNRLRNSTIATNLLPKEFTLTELYNLYLAILDKNIDKRNFLKKLKTLNIIRMAGGERRDGPHRPAKLYSFISEKVIPLDVF